MTAHDEPTRLAEVVRVSDRVGETASRLEKVERLAALLGRLRPEEIAIVAPWLSGDLRQGRIGVGPATLEEAWAWERPARTPPPPDAEPGAGEGRSGSGTGGTAEPGTGATPDPGRGGSGPAVAEVDRVFERIAGLSGAGSREETTGALRALFARATAAERRFLARLLLGELRQGAQEGLLMDALARAAGVPADRVRRAAMLTGDLSKVAARTLTEGSGALADLSVRLFRPLKPMLARTAEDVGDALERLGTAAFEHKCDGARIQVHRRGDEVAVYTRRLNDETGALPEVVEAVRALPLREAILDGEALALRPDGGPRPFQTTMRRFGRVRDLEEARREVPLSCFFFDCLQLDGEALIDEPARRRFEALDAAVPERLRVARRVTSDPGEARDFVLAALRAGHEGALAKALDAPYVAGRRGASWLKIKPSHSLDLVVLAAEWGHGRRQGWLSNLHLGARDAESGRYVMVGKTFKGMTDHMLEWQTGRLLELAANPAAGSPAPGRAVEVRPELVVEVAIDGVQRSPRYGGGVALRFARVKRYREDKDPREADTLQTLRAIQRGELTAF